MVYLSMKLHSCKTRYIGEPFRPIGYRWFTNVNQVFSRGQMGNQEAAVQRPSHLERSTFFSALMVRIQCITSLPKFCTQLHWMLCITSLPKFCTQLYWMLTPTLAFQNWSHAPWKPYNLSGLATMVRLVCTRFEGEKMVSLEFQSVHAYSPPAFVVGPEV